jgi:hypothetical protein
MTKNGFIFHVSCIILLIFIFLLSSCSQAVMNEQNQTKDVKVTDPNKKIVFESPNRMYHAIPIIMEDHPGWDWCACAEICMAHIDQDFGYVDQSILYPKRFYDTAPLYNAAESIRSFIPDFNGIIKNVLDVEGGGSPGLSYVKDRLTEGALMIDERISRIPPYAKYTVVIYGCDLDNNEIAFFDPNTGFFGWVNYSAFLYYLSDSNSESSFSNQMLSVCPYKYFN